MLDAQSLSEGRLSAAQIGQYWEEGFIFPIDVMTLEEAADARAEFE